MFILQKRLRHIKIRLKDWNKDEFGNIFEAKKTIEKKIQDLNQTLITEGIDGERNEQANKHQQEWEDLHKQDETFWRQKSRVQWLKEGDRNTRFFHSSTLEHRSHNRISTIKDSRDRSQFISDFTKHIPKLVTREDNYNLNRPVNEEEVSEVIKEMQNRKAPGLDGFNVDFFKACWSIVKQDILNVVEDSRNNRTILKAFNTAFISLIPKQDNAMTADRFRPIALCNVVYKIISKVIANKLQPLLPTLVSREQMGYVEGRQILNNIIQAHEVVHSLTSKRQAGMIMQLDLEKAYDKLNWAYISKVLLAYGFDHNWVRWVMALVTTSSFSILVNGSPSKIFTPSRGLRQGDPLSPFLFILMMEGLGRAIKSTKEEGKIQGLKLFGNRQDLTHQQFVDDTMLLGIPIVKEAQAYKQILQDFAIAAGTEVSLSKSKILFFNTNIAIQSNISRILGFQRDMLPSKYSGVLLIDKPLSKIVWEPMINKLHDKARKWTRRSLNLAGRLVLTKAVLQSIPIFMFSAPPPPKGVMQQYRNIQRDFLWGKGKEKKKWALVARDKICKPKAHGGLGLDDPEVLNKVVGTKLWWRWLKEPDAPWAQIWNKKYANNWQAKDHIRMSGIIKRSHIWNKAWNNRDIIQKNNFWEISAGDLA
eukprot:PITA_04744